MDPFRQKGMEFAVRMYNASVEAMPTRRTRCLSARFEAERNGQTTTMEMFMSMVL